MRGLFGRLGRWVARAVWAVTPACVAMALCALALWDTEHGGRGTLAQQAKRQEIAQARLRLAQLNTEVAELEHRVNSMRGETMDLDLLDQMAREMLNQFGKDELVIPYDTLPRPR